MSEETGRNWSTFTPTTTADDDVQLAAGDAAGCAAAVTVAASVKLEAPRGLGGCAELRCDAFFRSVNASVEVRQRRSILDGEGDGELVEVRRYGDREKREAFRCDVLIASTDRLNIRQRGKRAWRLDVDGDDVTDQRDRAARRG